MPLPSTIPPGDSSGELGPRPEPGCRRTRMTGPHDLPTFPVRARHYRVRCLGRTAALAAGRWSGYGARVLCGCGRPSAWCASPAGHFARFLGNSLNQPARLVVTSMRTTTTRRTRSKRRLSRRQRPACPGRAGLGARHLGRAGRPRAAPRRLDDPHDRRAAGVGRRPACCADREATGATRPRMTPALAADAGANERARTGARRCGDRNAGPPVT